MEKQRSCTLYLQARRLQSHLDPLGAVWYTSQWYPTPRGRWGRFPVGKLLPGVVCYLTGTSSLWPGGQWGLAAERRSSVHQLQVVVWGGSVPGMFFKATKDVARVATTYGPSVELCSYKPDEVGMVTSPVFPGGYNRTVWNGSAGSTQLVLGPCFFRITSLQFPSSALVTTLHGMLGTQSNPTNLCLRFLQRPLGKDALSAKRAEGAWSSSRLYYFLSREEQISARV